MSWSRHRGLLHWSKPHGRLVNTLGRLRKKPKRASGNGCVTRVETLTVQPRRDFSGAPLKGWCWPSGCRGAVRPCAQSNPEGPPLKWLSSGFLHSVVIDKGASRFSHKVTLLQIACCLPGGSVARVVAWEPVWFRGTCRGPHVRQEDRGIEIWLILPVAYACLKD